MQCIHFIGFRDSRQFWLAKQVFGNPHFIHIKWDARAAYGGEIDWKDSENGIPNDILIFAGKERQNVVSSHTVDDSGRDIPSDEELMRRGL